MIFTFINIKDKCDYNNKNLSTLSYAGSLMQEGKMYKNIKALYEEYVIFILVFIVVLLSVSAYIYYHDIFTNHLFDFLLYACKE